MKGLKKLLTGVLAATMIMSASITAFAMNDEGGLPATQEENQEPQAGANGQATAKEGSVTVNNAIVGEKYSLYKLLDFERAGDTNGVYTIDTDSQWWNFINGQAGVKDGKPTDNQSGVLTLTTVAGTSNKYYVSWTAGEVNTDESRAEALKDDAGVQAFAKAAMKYAATNNIAAREEKANSTSLTFDKLELGYYLVGSSTGALVSLDTANKAATVNEKNVIPGSEKKVEEDSSNKYGDRDDAEIGQTVNFKSTVTIPAGGAKNVVFYDKMTKGLSFSKNSVSVTVGTGTDRVDLVEKKYATVTTEGAKYEKEDVDFIVTFDTAYTAALTADTTITIAYSATVNEKAKIGAISTELGTGNDNKSRITYGNAGKTEWDWTRTYVYGFNIFKHNANDEALEGAEFELYRGFDIDGATPVSLVQLEQKKVGTDAEGKDIMANAYRFAKTTGETGVVVSKVVTPKSGYVVIEGFDGDSYALKEIKAPLGYNLLAEPVKVQVDAKASTQYDKNSYQATENTYQIMTGETVWTADTVKVENLTGSLLPSTGGMGTTIFYILGSILIVAGVAYFIVRRKASAE